jgi:hypothetical protein
MSANIFGSGTSILGMANSLLDNGRAIFQRNGGPGLSGRSRQLLESFYSNGPAIFNQLYTRTENAEVSNALTIKALRSKNESLVAEGVFEDPNADNGKAAASSTTGTQVDTEA